MTTETAVCRVRRLGRIEYADAATVQERMIPLRVDGRIPDTLLLLEHPHVITMGRNSSAEHVLVGEDRRRQMGIDLHEAGRGGDVTYHGPGQVVGYPILRLEGERRDAHRYLRDLEEVLIRTLRTWDLEGQRDPDHTGVWVGGAKVAAIGVRLTKWVTSHGFALNVQPDLTYFGTIVPCGIRDREVTSLRQLLGKPVAMDVVEDRLVEAFGEVFGLRMEDPGREDR